jgi:hypothetical protein
MNPFASHHSPFLNSCKQPLAVDPSQTSPACCEMTSLSLLVEKGTAARIRSLRTKAQPCPATRQRIVMLRTVGLSDKSLQLQIITGCSVGAGSFAYSVKRFVMWSLSPIICHPSAPLLCPSSKFALDVRLGWAEIPLDLAKRQFSKKRLFLTGFLPSKETGNPSHPQKGPADFFIA